jgi:methionyl-tRNA formyltransferase
MKKINIIFFGTGNFAKTILQNLIVNTLVEIKMIITQPDKPIGRKQELQAPPIKILAEQYKLNISQPANLKTYDLDLKTYDLNIVVDYGLFIPQNIIDIPKFGSINIHPSLLPKYRGSSPIQSVLVNGESKTGVSIMLIDAEMDHGPILTQKELGIEPDDTYTTLSAKTAVMASKMLTDVLSKHIDGSIKPQFQDDNKATFCKILTREDGLIDFNKTALEIYNQYRGLTPWPGVYVETQNHKSTTLKQRLKLLKILPVDKNIAVKKIVYENNKIFIGCKNGSMEVLELQMEGKKPMEAKYFINGYKYLNNRTLI